MNSTKYRIFYNQGKRLKELRKADIPEGKKKCRTQEEAAELFLVSVSAYKDYERGVSFPDRDSLYRIAAHYGCSVDYLLCFTDTKTYSASDIPKLIGISGKAVDFLKQGHNNILSAAAAAGTTPEAQNIDAFTPSAALLLSQLIEDAPVEFTALMRNINRFLSLCDDTVTGSHYDERGAAEWTCSTALHDLLKKASESPRFKALSRTVLAYRTIQQTQALYDANNPHKNRPEA